MNASALQEAQNRTINQYSNNPKGLLKWIAKHLPNERVIMGTGFGPPGLVLLDMLFKVTRNISVFYIDTDFLFEQTFSYILNRSATNKVASSPPVPALISNMAFFSSASSFGKR